MSFIAKRERAGSKMDGGWFGQAHRDPSASPLGDALRRSPGEITGIKSGFSLWLEKSRDMVYNRQDNRGLLTHQVQYAGY